MKDNNVKKSQRRKSWVSRSVWLALLFAPLALGWALDLRVNLTDSVPIGLYKKMYSAKMPLQRHDIVAVCLPDQLAQVGLTRGYLTKGLCPSGAMPVIKQLIALPGDLVTVTGQAIIVNGLRYLAPVQPIDHRGQGVKRWVTFYQSQRTKGYWLYGFHNRKDSWDSRYFGAICRQAIQGVYRHLG